MSMNLMAQAMNTRVGNHLRKLVLMKLADNANDAGECWPSYQHIADNCECSKSAVKQHINALINMGFVSKENRLGNNNGKGNTSNVYYLNLPVISAPATRHPRAPNTPPPVVNNTPPVVFGDTPPRAPDDTRTSHSLEPVIEPNTPL